MSKHPYIIKRPGSQSYYYHRQIPRHLQPVLKREQFWKSLRTPVLATAVRNAALVGLQFTAEMERAELELSAAANLATATAAARKDGTHHASPSLELNDGHIQALCVRYTTALLRTDDDERAGLEPCDVLERRKWLSDAHETLSLYAAGMRTEVMAESANTLLAAEGMRAEPSSDAYRDLLAALQATDLKVLAEQIARLHGRGVSTSTKDPLPPRDCDNWDVILKTWRTINAPRPRTYDSAVADAKRFDELVGHVAIPKLTTAHVETFKEALRTERGPGKKVLSRKRINDILRILGASINVAIKEGVTTLQSNPFQGTLYGEKALADDGPRKNRDAFSMDEMQTLFSSRIYTDPEYRPGKGGGEAAFWLPFLAPHMGPRLEDLGCVHIGDVRQYEGTYYIELGDRKAAGRNPRRGAYRKVPLHQAILDANFLDFVKWRKDECAGSNGRLFDRLKPNQYGTYTAIFSTWFGEYMDDIGLTDNRLDFHALSRSTFQYFGELAGLDRDVIDVFVGHKPDSGRMRNRYGRKDPEEGVKVIPFPILVDAMKRYRLSGLDLSHIKWRAPTSAAKG